MKLTPSRTERHLTWIGLIVFAGTVLTVLTSCGQSSTTSPAKSAPKSSCVVSVQNDPLSDVSAYLVSTSPVTAAQCRTLATDSTSDFAELGASAPVLKVIPSLPKSSALDCATSITVATGAPMKVYNATDPTLSAEDNKLSDILASPYCQTYGH